MVLKIMRMEMDMMTMEMEIMTMVLNIMRIFVLEYLWETSVFGVSIGWGQNILSSNWPMSSSWDPY